MANSKKKKADNESMYKGGGGEAAVGFRDPETGQRISFDEPINFCDPDYDTKIAEARRKAIEKQQLSIPKD